MMMETIQQAADLLAAACPRLPLWASFWAVDGRAGRRIEAPVYVPYSEIPGFAVSTAPGHAGRFVAGQLAGKQVLCMQGRLHYYESHSMQDIVFPIRVMKALGVETLILTNAAGGVNTSFSVGDLMLLEDHINFMGANPLTGPNDEAVGPRFCDMTFAYTPALRELAEQVAEKQGVALQKGVYLGYMGPSYETPAEIRAFRTLGADAVGMSTVPEVIAASHCGLKVLAMSLITNMAAGIEKKKLSGDEVDRDRQPARTGAAESGERHHCRAVNRKRRETNHERMFA